jgi:2-haloacid dehalogenase
MSYAIGFDVYGTLIDPLRIAQALRELTGSQSDAIARLWREKQLEYSFRRGLMRNYQSFDVCTEQALEYATRAFGVSLTRTDRTGLLEQYRNLPAYEDALAGIEALQNQDHALYAFSNGVEASVRQLLKAAGILSLLAGVVSVDDVRTFKPDPRVYEYLVNRAQRDKQQTWLVSSNSFDVLGAQAAGLRTVWVRRSSEALFDPWGVEPDRVIGTLSELTEALA